MPCTDCTHIQVELGCLKEFMRGWFTVVNDKLSGLEDGQKVLMSRFDKQDETFAKGDKDTVASHTADLNIVQNNSLFSATFPVESAVYEDENAITSVPACNSAMESEPFVASADVILNTDLYQSQITTQDFTGYGKLGDDFQNSVSPVQLRPSLSVCSQYESAQNAGIGELHGTIKTEPLLPQSQSADKQAYLPISSGQIGFQNNLSPHVSDVLNDSNVDPPYLNQSVMQTENFAVTDTRDIAAKQLQSNAVESVLKTHRRISKRQGRKRKIHACTNREGKQSKTNDNASAQEAYILCSCSNSNKCNLSSRIIASMGEKHFQCGYCKKKFAQKGNLVTHVRLHTGEKPYSCNYCENRFSTKATLIRHVSSHEKPYQCIYCEKRFAQKFSLVHHERLHTGESFVQVKHFAETNTPVIATKHLKSSAVKSALKTQKHISKPHGCRKIVHTDRKGKQSRTNDNDIAANNHQENHILRSYSTSNKCKYCQKKLSRKDHLFRHMKLHTGEKPYQCSCCEKRFIQKVGLVCHERLHTGEKPYQCGFCERRFSQRGNCKTHERHLHSDRP